MEKKNNKTSIWGIVAGAGQAVSLILPPKYQFLGNVVSIVGLGLLGLTAADNKPKIVP